MAQQQISGRKLTEEERQHFQNWTKTKMGGIPRCPFCGSNNWQIHEYFMELRTFHDGAVLFGGGSVAPAVMLICMNCANTVLINALVSGVLVTKPEAKPAGKSGVKSNV